MRELLKPKALTSGALLGIVSPASTPRPERVYAGIAALEAMSYRARLYPHALTRGPLYYAGTVEQRLADLHAAFTDTDVDAVICTRGGWGSAELLPHLSADLVRANAKPFLGYSDHTSLHLWLLEKCGMVSFQAPMVAADFSKPDGVDLLSWHAALSSQEPWTIGQEAGLRVLKPGTAEGTLTGGCLAIYAEALGTPYAASPPNGILFLEDIGVKPYQWDRMLRHLHLAGMLRDVKGIVLGDMTQSGSFDEQPAIEASVLHALADFTGPIAIGLRSGHVDRGNITLPFGVRVKLECEDVGNPRMHFLEPSVRR